jgi:hypothetical protein
VKLFIFIGSGDFALPRSKIGFSILNQYIMLSRLQL